MEFKHYRINHKFSHFTFMSLWVFFIIKVLKSSSKVSISWQCWLILLPDVSDSWRCNFTPFFFTSARSEININRRVARQEDNSIVITLDLVNMKKCWVASFFFRVNFNLMHLKEFKQTKKNKEWSPPLFYITGIKFPNYKILCALQLKHIENTK